MDVLERLQGERQQLSENIDKLEAFISSGKHNYVPGGGIMPKQLNAMRSYRTCLDQRITLVKADVAKFGGEPLDDFEQAELRALAEHGDKIREAVLGANEGANEGAGTTTV